MPTPPSATSVNQATTAGQAQSRATEGHEPDLPLEVQPPPGETLYERLCYPFDHTYEDVRGGVALTYVTGAQVINRLNLCCDGPFGWSFVVLESLINPEADEVVVHGRLGVRNPDTGEWIYRDQFGSQKVRRQRSTGVPLDLGFDYMGAATACLKKCASLYGVSLYLMAKPVPSSSRSRPRAAPTSRPSDDQDREVVGSEATRPPRQMRDLPPPAIKCENCSQELRPGADGKPAHQQANDSLKEFRRVYCPACQELARQQKASAAAAG